MIVIGIDPSFTRTGIAIIDMEGGIVEMCTISPFHSTGRNFEDIIRVGINIQGILQGLVMDIRPDIVVSEAPFPLAQYSSALYALDALVVTGLQVDYTVHPSYLRQVMGYNYDKKDAVIKVRGILEELKVRGWEVPSVVKFSTGKEMDIPHDCAEAFLIALSVCLGSRLYYDSVEVRKLNLRGSSIVGWDKIWNAGV